MIDLDNPVVLALVILIMCIIGTIAGLYLYNNVIVVAETTGA